MTNNIVPAYLVLAADGVTIKLSTPTELNGTTVDSLRMRTPMVRDMRNATAVCGDDNEQLELNLFASLAEVGVKDLENMTLKDYERVKKGYRFLVNES
ncbi:phage tail assembly protein [Pseudomonas entomophila]|uniref:phage tail assembly protein n=1 Tax=Pseudomonas entomophila TaxID=312306 RepID=UPI0015E27045|nr:phage tail assembly protein [Pseudomonas entomophila]MBA1187969.1 phage tail assembly protein [Pseudomonas entomophila]